MPNLIFESLASSSSGNSYIIDDGNTRILLECGLSYKKLQQLTKYSLTHFDACLVSHCHKDHSKCVEQLIKDGMQVYMSEGTADALGVCAVNYIQAMEQFRVGSLDIVPFATFHDAAEPFGFLIKSRIDGDVLAFATDTVNLRYQFPGLTILAIEANYKKEILERHEKLPDKVKHRIANTHMEIDTLCEYLAELDLSRCREIYLLHLSDASSCEAEFVDKVLHTVPPGITVTACKK